MMSKWCIFLTKSCACVHCHFIQDECYQVRQIFAQKLHLALVKLLLPLEYLAVFALCAKDPVKERRAHARQCLLKNISVRREYIKQNPLAQGRCSVKAISIVALMFLSSWAKYYFLRFIDCVLLDLVPVKDTDFKVCYSLLQQKNLCHSFLSMLFPTWFIYWPMTQTSQNHKNMISSKTSKSQSWFCYCDHWYKTQKTNYLLCFSLSVQVPLVYAGSADDQEWKQQSRISSKDGWEHQTDQGCTVCRWRKGQWGYHACLERKWVYNYRWLYQMVDVVFIVVSCCNCRSCTSSAMSHSLLSPTKALRVIWILPKNLSCPPNSSFYKTRQCTLGRSFLNWWIEDT